MPFVKVTGMYPSLEGSKELLEEGYTSQVNFFECSVQNIIGDTPELAIVSAAVDIAYACPGVEYVSDFILVEIILWRKKERTKSVLDSMCKKVERFITKMYKDRCNIKIAVLADVKEEAKIGLSVGYTNQV